MQSTSSCWAALTIRSGRLAKTAVNHFHAGVSKSSGDYLGAAVVAVQAGLGYQDSDGLLTHGCATGCAQNSRSQFPFRAGCCRFDLKNGLVIGAEYLSQLLADFSQGCVSLDARQEERHEVLIGGSGPAQLSQ